MSYMKHYFFLIPLQIEIIFVDDIKQMCALFI